MSSALLLIAPFVMAAGTDPLPAGAAAAADVLGGPPQAATSADRDPGDARRISGFRFDPRGQRAKSVGAPNSGRLEGGVLLAESGPGWRRTRRSDGYGTDETVALIEYAADRLIASYPGSQPLVIGDISAAGGGRLRPHRSHQSGRDVDIAFFERGNPERKSFRRHLAGDQIDVEKTWFVLETLILTGRVQYVFINRRLLGRFEAEARRAGWSDTELERLFQHPGARRGRGIVRHASGHEHHFHVRFACPPDNRRCRP